MKFRPLHDRVVVKRIDAEERPLAASSFRTCKEKPRRAKSPPSARGRDEAGKLIPIRPQVGDRVLFGKWSGTEVKIDGEDS